MKRIELLSPAGDFECLKAAINNGADAVYLGGSNFSARAFASNFDNELIKEAVNYAHLRDVKVYVTINTLMNEIEIDNAYKIAKYYKDINVDAILIQDLGLFYRLRSDFPDLELHASTQLHIHNLEGVRNAKKLGFNRAVIARESSLDFIKKACKEGIEIETFVHGAICVSYSGECLMSSLTKNRSANKGMCAQCCRMRYDLYEGEKKVSVDTPYLLSPKDMYLLENIPDLIEAGVSSLKIEGRMKSAAYVGYITSMYRNAIDAYYENREFKVDKKEFDNIKSLFNRGFTNTYLLNDNKPLFNNERPNHMGIKVGEVIKFNGSVASIKLSRDLNQFDGVRIINGNSDGEGTILNMLKVNGKLVSKAFKGEIIELKSKFAKQGDILVKTKDYNLEESIINRSEKKLPISLKIRVYPEENIQVAVMGETFEFSYTSKETTQTPLKSPISKENIIDTFNKVGEYPYCVNSIDLDMKDSFISLKVLNEIRRNFYEELNNYRLNSFKRVEIPFNIPEIKKPTQDKNLVMYSGICEELNPLYYNEVINLDSNYAQDNNFISDFGGILHSGFKVGSYTLNVTNSYAYEFLLRLGFNNVVLSLECKADDIRRIKEGFKARNGFDISPYVYSYGRRELMHIARNPFKSYIDNINNAYLSDGNNKYRLLLRKDNLDLLEYDPFILDTGQLDGVLSFKKINFEDEI